MDIREISYIIAIADKQSITAAAASLFISQPALSQALRRMEAEAGCKLFVRSGNMTVPTEAGRLLVERGRLILNARDKMLSDVRGVADGRHKTLRFGISPFYSKYYLPDVFRYYVQNLPGVKLEVVEKSSLDLERMVIEDELPFCFVPALPANPELHYHVIGSEEIMLAVPQTHPANALADESKDGLRMDLLYVRDEPFILLPPKQKVSELQTRIFHYAGFTPRVSYATSNWDTAMILTGLRRGAELSAPAYCAIRRCMMCGPAFITSWALTLPASMRWPHRSEESLGYSAEQLITLMGDIVRQKNTL